MINIKNLLVTIFVLLLILFNVWQWYLNKDNNILSNDLKASNERITSSIDSINVVNLKLKDSLKLKDTLIANFEKEKTKYINLKRHYQNEYNKKKKDYNNLDRNHKYNSVKDLLTK